MALLPQFQTKEQGLSLLQTTWAAVLNPIISRNQNNSIILQSVSLKSGANIINHGLNKKLSGWKLVRQRASASIYDTQDSNPNPEVSLFLNASAAVVVDLEVF